MTTPPPGWYDDGNGAVRWWDGANWTDHIAAPSAAPTVAQPIAETLPVAAAADDTAVQPTAETVPLPPVDPTAAGPVPPYVGSGYATSAYGSGGYAPAGYAVSAPDPQAGTVIAPAEPRKSRLWILWVALGAIFVGVVIALIVLSPMLWSGLVAGGSSSPSAAATPSAETTPAAEESSAGSGGAAPTEADQQAAVATVERHNQAWLTGDCDGFMATTTEALREFMEIPDCATFTVESRNFAGGVDDYVTTIRDVEVLGDAVAVSTSETYTSRFDAEGNQTDETLEYEDRYEYIVVLSNGAWVIDDFFAE